MKRLVLLVLLAMIGCAKLIPGSTPANELPDQPPRLVGQLPRAKRPPLRVSAAEGAPVFQVAFRPADVDTCLSFETDWFGTPMEWTKALGWCAGYEIKLAPVPLPVETTPFQPWVSGVAVWVTASQANGYKNPFRPDTKTFKCNCSWYYPVDRVSKEVTVPLGALPDGNYTLTVSGVGPVGGKWERSAPVEVKFSVPLEPVIIEPALGTIKILIIRRS